MKSYKNNIRAINIITLKEKWGDKIGWKEKKLKSKAKIIQKYSKDGLVEHNFRNTTRNISQKIEDVNLEKT